jgi:hypothetical protein
MLPLYLIPRYSLNINQQPHQFRYGQGWMRVIQLNCHLKIMGHTQILVENFWYYCLKKSWLMQIVFLRVTHELITYYQVTI